jgi:hypothetical protein
MWNWVKNLFKKNEYRPKVYTLYDFFMHYRDAEKQVGDMHSYVYENWKDKHMCDPQPFPSRHLMRRYSMSYNRGMQPFTWYLLEQYFKGNIIIKEDVKTQQGNEATNNS